MRRSSDASPLRSAEILACVSLTVPYDSSDPKLIDGESTRKPDRLIEFRLLFIGLVARKFIHVVIYMLALAF